MFKAKMFNSSVCKFRLIPTSKGEKTLNLISKLTRFLHNAILSNSKKIKIMQNHLLPNKFFELLSFSFQNATTKDLCNMKNTLNASTLIHLYYDCQAAKKKKDLKFCNVYKYTINKQKSLLLYCKTKDAPASDQLKTKKANSNRLLKHIISILHRKILKNKIKLSRLHCNFFLADF